MATKESKSNVCTVTLSATEITVVTLPDKYNSFNVRNDSAGVVNISVSDTDVTANGDDVYSIPAGQSICTAPVTATTTLYVGTGSGSLIIAGINSVKNRPFDNSGSGGGGSSYILPTAGVNTLGGVQAKAKTDENAECAIGADNKLYAPVPVKLLELINDAGFIDNTVDNLLYYYTKSDTYNRTEIATLISNLKSLSVLIVPTLPTENISTTTFYLIKIEGTNNYEQWMYISGAWANLGSTAINLENYYTKAEIDDLLDGKVDKATGMGLSSNDFTTLLKAKLDGIAEGANINVIEGIKRNGTALEVINGAVNIAVPEINDTATTSTTETWSAKKISDKIAEVSGGEANVIESISVNGEAIEPDGNKNVDITVPVVTKEKTTETTEVARDPLTNKLYVPASSGGGDSGKLIQQGEGTLNSGNLSVTYPTEFSTVPIVLFQPMETNSNSLYDIYPTSSTAFTVSGFSVSTKKSSGLGSGVLKWIAIGT